MGTWIHDTLATGAMASTGTTVAAALLGQAENGSAVGPLNAVSHILWGEQDTDTDEPDVRHTAVGLTLNAAAVTAWAGVHEAFMPRERRPSPSRALLTGAAVATVAYITDYHVVPKRLTPGFEKRLSGKALFTVYGMLALALAAGSLTRR